VARVVGFFVVMAGLVPAIHDLFDVAKTWMPAGMTEMKVTING
jgi:hypothetical protein